MDTLIKVLESRAFASEANAAKALVDCYAGGVDRPGLEKQAKQEAEKALFNHAVIDALIGIRDANALETFTAIPTTNK